MRQHFFTIGHGAGDRSLSAADTKEGGFMRLHHIGLFGFFLLFAILPSTALYVPVSAAPEQQGDDTLAQADALFDQGQQHMQAGRLQAALESFEAALLLYQESDDSHIFLPTYPRIKAKDIKRFSPNSVCVNMS